MISDQVQQAIAQITAVSDCDTKEGTGFLIGPNLLLTAYHVVQDTTEIKVTFLRPTGLHITSGTVQQLSSNRNDVAVVLLADPPFELHPLPLRLAIPEVNEHWETHGFPQIHKLTGRTYEGKILQKNLLVAWPVTLLVYGISTSDNLKGLSGSPLIVDDEVCGFLRIQQGGDVGVMLFTQFADELTALGVAAQPQDPTPSRFRNDIRRLNAYSIETLDQLARFTTIEVPEGIISIIRPVVDLVVQAALLGNLAITGEPGAGKSAIVYEAAQKLTLNSPVFCFTVESGANTLSVLQREIGLEHPLIDVLKQVPGSKPAYLLLDALDASRGGAAEATYKKLLELVVALPDWHVIASVRSFDLRMGRDWQRLFRGSAPFSDYTDQSFPAVRHLHIGLLGHEERDDLARKSPTLDTALTAGGSRLEALAQNPFNLDLLADLLTGGIPPTALAGVTSRGQLLARYWQERIDSLGLPANVSLAYLVKEMLRTKAIAVSQTRIEPSTAVAIDSLEGAGVLTLEPTRRTLGFRHQVLFDYAVAQLALLPSTEEATAQVRKERAAGLLIAPSLAYWVEGLKSLLFPSDFWSYIAALVADRTIDPIVRVEVARLTIEVMQSTDNLADLTRFFSSDDVSATQSFRQFGGALTSKLKAKQPFEAGPWARLLASMTAPNTDQLGIMQSLIGELLESTPDADTLACLGIAARNLFALIADDEDLTNWLSRFVIPYIVQTYCTDPTASRQQLARVFEPERFARSGYLEVPALARHALVIAAHDTELAFKLYQRAFQRHDFSQDQTTPMMRSHILAVHSNAAQDFRMAEYELAKAFPALLIAYPETGIRALAVTLHGVREREQLSTENLSFTGLSVGDVEYPFEEDSSAMWAWEIDKNRGSNYDEIYQAFSKWIPTVQDPALLAALPNLLLSESGIALVWRVLFEAGTAQPVHLGSTLVHPASSSLAIQSISTRRSAIALLAVIHPQIPASAQEEAEQEWLQWDFAAYQEPQAVRALILGKLFNALGEAQLATEAARGFLQEARNSGHSLENGELFTIGSVETRRIQEGEEDGLGGEDHLLPTGEVNPVPQLIRRLQNAQTDFRNQATEEMAVRLQEDLVALEAAGSIEGTNLDDALIATLAKGLSCLLSYQPTVLTTPAALDQLLRLTQHPSPQVDASTEEEFAESQIWDYPQARVEAAKALASLVSIPGLWPLIETRFEAMLLGDPHPVVRMQLVNALSALTRVEEEAAWQLAEKFAAHENNPAVIQFGAIALQPLAHRNAARLEPLILALSSKAGTKDILTHLIVFFALKKELAASYSRMRDWVVNYPTEEKQLLAIVVTLREYFALGYKQNTPIQAAIGQRVKEFVWLLVEMLEPAVRTWSTSDREPTINELVALNIFNEIASQFFFAVGYREMPHGLVTLEAQRQFLSDYAPLISRLTTLGTPNTVHNMLKVLSRFVEANPVMCFGLFSEAILRTTGVAKYEYEPLGASQFVELVSQYLANYRSIFIDDTRRNKLIECLAVFVDAGWPEARRLFQNLPDLLQ